jgi:hypothetical protein
MYLVWLIMHLDMYLQGALWLKTCASVAGGELVGFALDRPD